SVVRLWRAAVRSSLPLPDALPICSQPDSHEPSLGPGSLLLGEEALVVGYLEELVQRLLVFARVVDVAVSGLPTRRAIRELVGLEDRKSTRLNSSHVKTSYAGFCLK